MNSDKPDYSKKRFLVVDDSPFVCKIDITMLTKCGVTNTNITQCNRGDEEMRLLAKRADEIACVICDWNMEPVGGVELLRQIRMGSATKRDLPFLMLTGHADEDLVKTAIVLDAHGYLVKPVSLAKMVKALEGDMTKQMRVKLPAQYKVFALPDLMIGQRKDVTRI